MTEMRPTGRQRGPPSFRYAVPAPPRAARPMHISAVRSASPIVSEKAMVGSMKIDPPFVPAM